MIISNREYTNFSSFESYFLWCRRRFYRFYRLGCEIGFDMLCTHDIITHCYECTGDGYADLYCKFATQQSCKHYHSMFCKSKRHMPSSSFFVLHFVSRPLSPPDRVSPDQNPASCVLHALHYHLTYKNKKKRNTGYTTMPISRCGAPPSYPRRPNLHASLVIYLIFSNLCTGMSV